MLDPVVAARERPHALADDDRHATGKVVIFNVKYSPNLGDGVIAECLESELARRLEGFEIKSLDLAGRTHWPVAENSRARLLQLEMLRRMPRWLRDLVVEAVLRLRVQRHCVPLWRQELQTADGAIFGGGQLIQDRDLNFPIKLSIAASECARRGVPMTVYSVGAAPSVSSRGARLLSSLLNTRLLTFVSARDEESAQVLRAFGLPHVELTPDPGLLSARLWAAAPKCTALRPVVGLCVTHPAVLQHHGTPGTQVGDTDLDLYQQLVSELLAGGYDVTCFSNGAHEDHALLTAAYQRFRQLDPAGVRVRIARRCTRPRDLALLVSSFHAVIAHRLHACILAYAYRVPHIGLTWDPKLLSFFARVKRDEYAIPLSQSAMTAISSLLAKALSEGVNPQVHAHTLDDASASIDRLAFALLGGTRRPRPDDAIEQEPPTLSESRSAA